MFLFSYKASAGTKVPQLAEAVDLYKTLADLSGVGVDKVEAGVDGVSLASVVKKGASADPPRLVARSQFPRCYTAVAHSKASAKFRFCHFTQSALPQTSF
jgi:arylsulfatase A-like enzyme